MKLFCLNTSRLSVAIAIFSLFSCIEGEDVCTENDCGGNGECVDEGGVATCICDVGYTASALECVEPCELDCGAGNCRLDDGEAVCDCEPGFFTAPGAPHTCIWTDAQRCADMVEVGWECYEEFCARRGFGSPFCECFSRTTDISQFTCGCIESDFESSFQSLCSLVDFEEFIPQTDYECEAAEDAVLGIGQ
ncbi:MAG: hypothetical protein GY822_00450 [Deltaproteobacteria bacterium]|nr:hypothetical protein [Deltaproteobacteria bacterium]